LLDVIISSFPASRGGQVISSLPAPILRDAMKLFVSFSITFREYSSFDNIVLEGEDAIVPKGEGSLIGLQSIIKKQLKITQGIETCLVVILWWKVL